MSTASHAEITDSHLERVEEKALSSQFQVLSCSEYARDLRQAFCVAGTMEDDKTTISHRLIQREWPLFQSVQGIGGPSACQSDKRTFYIMRMSQFMTWPLSALKSYEEDLKLAEAEGRNLLTEKYAYMMCISEPGQHQILEDSLPGITQSKQDLIVQIVSVIMVWASEMEQQFPWLMKASRPISSGQDTQMVSIETYTKGELSTYSERTLTMLLRYYQEAKASGKNLHKAALERMISYYGYDSMTQADLDIKARFGPGNVAIK